MPMRWRKLLKESMENVNRNLHAVISWVHLPMYAMKIPNLTFSKTDLLP